jgi:hypothetical protein
MHRRRGCLDGRWVTAALGCDEALMSSLLTEDLALWDKGEVDRGEKRLARGVFDPAIVRKP